MTIPATKKPPFSDISEQACSVFYESLASYAEGKYGDHKLLPPDEFLKWAVHFFSVLRKCKSPIEQVLCAMSLFVNTEYRFVYPSPNWHVMFVCQKSVGKYTADFLWTVTCIDGRRAQMVVEADGHDFHERTKKQAAHDKKRDRWFSNNGYKVLRFSGSEIWNNPHACMDDIVSGLTTLIPTDGEALAWD